MNNQPDEFDSDWNEPESTQKPKEEPVGGCLIAAMIILTVFIPCIGPVIALIVGIVNHRRPGALAIIIVAAVFMLCNFGLLPAITLPNYIKAREKAREAEVKSNCHSIQIALERYAVDSGGYYPPGSSVLKEYGYVLQFPRNPFTEDSREMHDIEFGSEPFEGDFTYIPIQRNIDTLDYYLLGYGHKNNPGFDCDDDGNPDNVIIIISSQGRSLTRPDEELPEELRELLNPQS